MPGHVSGLGLEMCFVLLTYCPIGALVDVPDLLQWRHKRGSIAGCPDTHPDTEINESAKKIMLNTFFFFLGMK